MVDEPKTPHEIVREATAAALNQAGFRWDGSSYHSENGREFEEQHWKRGFERISVIVKERP